jgi:hypothetical protein
LRLCQQLQLFCDNLGCVPFLSVIAYPCPCLKPAGHGYLPAFAAVFRYDILGQLTPNHDRDKIRIGLALLFHSAVYRQAKRRY